MSLLNKASLIQIPSGYKDGTLYSAKPINGDGDFTFSRGSNLSATRVNSEGLIEKGRENRLLQSNNFNTSPYSPTNATVTSGFEGYDGSNDGWKVASTTIGSETRIRQSQTFTTGEVITLSVYMKKGNVNFGIVRNYAITGGGRAWFDLENGTVATENSGINGSIEDVGNGWYRCSIWGVINTTGAVDISPAPSDGDYLADAVGEFIYVQDSQLENGLVATDYIETTTTTAQAGILEDMPRLDYSGGATCGSLILEPQRTNLITQSEYIDSWTKTNSPTITTNIATAPDGTVSAGGIQDTTGGTFKRIRQSTSVSANSTNTASVFVKKETIQTNFGGLALTYTGGTAKFAYAIINPVDGTIVVSSDSVIGATSTKAEDYGNWWRFSLTATDNGGNTNLEIAYYATISTNGTSTGVGIGSVRTIWGFQLEIGATYATSYIPTYGASSTRSQDSCGKTGISSLIGQTEGTIYIETTPLNDVTTYTERLIKFEDGGSDLIGVNRYSNSFLNYYGVNSGSTQWSINVADVFEGSQKTKIACAYKENDIVIYVDGVQKATDTTASIPTTDRMYFANDASGGLTYIGKHTQAILFPTRLTNDELAELTTL